MGMGIRDGAALMRSSWELVRGDRALLWFPVAAAFCLLLTAGFWLFEGAWVATYSLVVQLALSVVESIKGFRWVGKAAEVAWSFATFFVIPLIALEGLDGSDARQRSFRLAKANWRTETAGPGTFRAAMFVPCLLFAGAFELLRSDQVHSRAGQAVLGLVLVVGVVVGVVATVVRQVFAVSLYRTSAP